jgi:hypothetical protein
MREVIPSLNIGDPVSIQFESEILYGRIAGPVYRHAVMIDLVDGTKRFYPIDLLVLIKEEEFNTAFVVKS